MCSVSNLSFSYLYILSHPSMHKSPLFKRAFVFLPAILYSALFYEADFICFFSHTLV